MIAGRVGEVLLDAQVALGRLDRRMAKRHLDLFQPRPALVGQLGVGATQIVWRQMPPPELSHVLPQNEPDALSRHRLMGKLSAPVDRPEHPPAVNSGSGAPLIDG